MKDITLFKHPDALHFRKITSKAELIKDEAVDGYLIESSEKEARRIIDSLRGSGKRIAVVGGDAAFNRRAIETLTIDYLVSAERGLKRDSLKQRDSGLNHVMLKEAAKRGIAIVVDMSLVSVLEGKAQAEHLSRVMQNVVLCRKAGCGLKLASFASDKRSVIDVKGRAALGTSLGMSSAQAKAAVQF